MEICGMFSFAQMRCACVPFPAPGGPRKMMFILLLLSSVCSSNTKYACRSNTSVTPARFTHQAMHRAFASVGAWLMHFT